MSYTIALPYPPSVNRSWRNFRGHTVQSTEAKNWKRQAGLMAKQQGAQVMEGSLSVQIALHPRMTAKGIASKTRLDLDNTFKATLDALNGVAWVDDKQIHRLAIELSYPVEAGGLTVQVMEVF